MSVVGTYVSNLLSSKKSVSSMCSSMNVMHGIPSDMPVSYARNSVADSPSGSFGAAKLLPAVTHFCRSASSVMRLLTSFPSAPDVAVSLRVSPPPSSPPAPSPSPWLPPSPSAKSSSPAIARPRRTAGGALRRRPLCGGVATLWSLPRLPLRRLDSVLRSVLAQWAHNPVNRLLGGWEMSPSPMR